MKTIKEIDEQENSKMKKENQFIDNWLNKHFGISNVSARISNPLYGNGSVRIDSHPGNGTYVTIEFQQMEDTDEENNDCR